MFQKAQVTTKLVAVSIAALAAVLIAGIGFISWTASQVTQQLTVHQAEAVAREQAEYVRRTMEEGLTAARGFAFSLNGLKSAEMTDRAAWSSVVEETMKSNTSLSGAWAAVTNNALDGKDEGFRNAELHDESGEWRPYYYRLPDGNVGFRPLSDLDETEASNWFNVPYNTGKDYVTEPYSWEAGGKTVSGVSFGIPLRDSTGVIGVAGVDIMLTPLAETLNGLHPLETGSIHLLSRDGKWISHSDPALLGKDWAEGRSPIDAERASAVLSAVKTAQPFEYTGYSNSLNTEVLRIITPVAIGDGAASMSVVVNVPVATLNAASAGIVYTITGIGLLLLIVVGMSIYLVGNTIVRRPLEQVVVSIQALMDKRYDESIPGAGRHDEIGKIASALEVFREKAQEADMLAQEQEKQQEQQLARATQIRDLSESFDAKISHLVQTVLAQVSDLNGAAVVLTKGADHTSSQSTMVAAASEEASSNVETVASAAEELMASVEEIRRQMGESAEIAGQAVQQAQDTNAKIEGLAEAASRINEVVKLITDIAEQTNLLALNATIEAARAGEAGRGFAVVAAEVKELATQTAKATDEISMQIQSVQSETEGAVGAIQGISLTIEKMNEIANSIQGSVDQQGHATEEIARNIQEAANGTQDVARNIVTVASSADETGSTARQVSTVAEVLQSEASNLKDEVDGFLVGVRSAA
ncbi:methyl-accepting chemotaxis protein [Labrenzia sp. CE80]|uniref:methyl-accepting chemotaxis protein n=1 Tax=Labrenzia sp. CE80 TaxID=1788986 RepID=UPI00129BF24C|nr:methyl-accepting chemotaxis protein [Labrenzia sp. CE80]